MKTWQEVVAKAVEVSGEIKKGEGKVGTTEHICHQYRMLGMLDALSWMIEANPESEQLSA